MSRLHNPAFARLIRRFPGYQKFGEWAFLPVFFLTGAGLEYVMINWNFGEINFYKTFKRRQIQERAKAIVEEYLEQKKKAQP